MEGPPLGPGGEDITWPDQVAPRGRKASSTRKIKPQTSNLDHSWYPWSILFIYGHQRSSSIFVFTLRSNFHVPFWPISAYSKFGHEQIAQIYSVHVLNFRTHIFMYMLSSKPSVDSNERTCFPLYVYAFIWL